MTVGELKERIKSIIESERSIYYVNDTAMMRDPKVTSDEKAQMVIDLLLHWDERNCD